MDAVNSRPEKKMLFKYLVVRCNKDRMCERVKFVIFAKLVNKELHNEKNDYGV